jgi:hypothetical protein
MVRLWAAPSFAMFEVFVLFARFTYSHCHATEIGDHFRRFSSGIHSFIPPFLFPFYLTRLVALSNSFTPPRMAYRTEGAV